MKRSFMTFIFRLPHIYAEICAFGSRSTSKLSLHFDRGYFGFVFVMRWCCCCYHCLIIWRIHLMKNQHFTHFSDEHFIAQVNLSIFLVVFNVIVVVAVVLCLFHTFSGFWLLLSVPFAFVNLLLMRFFAWPPFKRIEIRRNERKWRRRRRGGMNSKRKKTKRNSKTRVYVKSFKVSWFFNNISSLWTCNKPKTVREELKKTRRQTSQLTIQRTNQGRKKNCKRKIRSRKMLAVLFQRWISN